MDGPWLSVVFLWADSHYSRCSGDSHSSVDICNLLVNFTNNFGRISFATQKHGIRFATRQLLTQTLAVVHNSMLRCDAVLFSPAEMQQASEQVVRDESAEAPILPTFSQASSKR